MNCTQCRKPLPKRGYFRTPKGAHHGSCPALVPVTSDAIHEWFSLTYASYLVLPRVLLQSMPVRWQRRFVKMLKEFEDSFQHVEHPQGYWVRARDGNRFVPETLPGYRHGYVEPRRAVRP